MSSLVAVPAVTDVEYPEGPKVPEGDVQTRRRMELLVALANWLAPRSDAWAYSDINIYYSEGNNNVVVAPDVAVVLGVDRDALAGQGVYRVWETGVPPTFVLEIASDSTRKRDLRNKPQIYADLGVEEYWRFDPTGGKYFKTALAGDHRRDGRWEPITILARIDDGALTGHSTTLGLDLYWQPPKLRLRDPTTGTWLLDGEEEAAARAAAEERAAALEARVAALEAELAAARQPTAHDPSP